MKWYRNLYIVLFYYFSRILTSRGVGEFFLFSKIIYSTFLFYKIIPKNTFGYTVVAAIFFFILDMFFIEPKGVYYTSDNIGYYYEKIENKGWYKIFLLTYLVFSVLIFVWLNSPHRHPELVSGSKLI